MDYYVVTLSIGVGPFHLSERFIVAPLVLEDLKTLQKSEGFTIVDVQKLVIKDREGVLEVVRMLKETV